MSEFPPHDRLLHVVGSVLAVLPREYATLLEAERFAEAREALARLAMPSALEAAVAAMTPAEATALADRLTERWERLGPVTLAPAAAIVGPADVWIGDAAAEVVFRVAVASVDEDWSAAWSGDVREAPDGRSAVLALPPVVAEAGGAARLAARVIARGKDGRCILLASRSIRIGKLQVQLDAARRRLLFLDSEGRPVAGLDVRIGETTYRTGRAGNADIEAALPPDAMIDVPGARIKCA